MRYTTFITGYNTTAQRPTVGLATLTTEEQFQYTRELEQWSRDHLVQFMHTGKCSVEAIERMAKRKGIVAGLRAEAVSFDQSGKGRHHRICIIK